MRVNKSFYISCIASRTACINCQGFLLYIYIYIYIYIHTFLGLQEEGTKDMKSLEKCEAVFKDRLQNPLSKEESLS